MYHPSVEFVHPFTTFEFGVYHIIVITTKKTSDFIFHTCLIKFQKWRLRLKNKSVLLIVGRT